MVDYLSYALEFEFIRFGVVGVLSLGAYYAVYTPCTVFKKEWYIVWTTFAFIAYISVAFPLQKYWAFRSPDLTTVEPQLIAFALQRLLFQGVNNLLLFFTVAKFNPPRVFRKLTVEGRLHPIPAQVFVHVTMVLPSYVITKGIFLFF